MQKIDFTYFVSSISSEFADASGFAEHSNRVEVFINSVKSEVKARAMTFGWNLSAEETEKLRDSLASRYTLTKNQPTGVVNLEYFSDNILLDFIEVCQYISTLEVVAPQRGRTYNTINEQGLFSNIASVMKTMSDTGMTGMMSRCVFDSVDHIISLNPPLAADSYREHIVPCSMIIEEAFRMFDEDDASIIEVATMIQQNLFIVHITKAQADFIDHTLGYKTTMPDGWTFGDNVFARLDAADINY